MWTGDLNNIKKHQDGDAIFFEKYSDSDIGLVLGDVQASVAKLKAPLYS